MRSHSLSSVDPCLAPSSALCLSGSDFATETRRTQSADYRAGLPVLLFHPLLKDVLNFQRVWHSQQSCGTQSKWSAFSVGGECNAVAMRVGISKCRWHIGSHGLD